MIFQINESSKISLSLIYTLSFELIFSWLYWNFFFYFKLFAQKPDSCFLFFVILLKCRCERVRVCVCVCLYTLLSVTFKQSFFILLLYLLYEQVSTYVTGGLLQFPVTFSWFSSWLHSLEPHSIGFHTFLLFIFCSVICRLFGHHFLWIDVTSLARGHQGDHTLIHRIFLTNVLLFMQIAFDVDFIESLFECGLHLQEVASCITDLYLRLTKFFTALNSLVSSVLPQLAKIVFQREHFFWRNSLASLHQFANFTFWLSKSDFLSKFDTRWVALDRCPWLAKQFVSISCVYSVASSDAWPIPYYHYTSAFLYLLIFQRLYFFIAFRLQLNLYEPTD